jgi:hypothetical protein
MILGDGIDPRMLKRLLIVIVAAALLTAVVLHLRSRAEYKRFLAQVSAEDEKALDDLHLDLEDIDELDPTSWVRQYRPEASAAGYTLVLYQRRVPMIIDMNGRVVHVWPQVRAVGRARLNRDGSLAVIGTDNLIKEYDWEGRLRWFHRLAVEADFPHHDLIRLANGNYLVLARENKETQTCYLEEVDRRRGVVWRWLSVDHANDFSNWNDQRKDPTHFNSIHELPPNRHYDAGDERFRPGNILVSARHLNTVFVIDKRSGQIVWQLDKGLDYQHEASMWPRGEAGDGQIVLFNNGRHNLNAYRRSLVQAIDPTAGKVVWQYGSKFFFSSIAGTAQTLPGGNYVITSSHGGRIFELTPDKEIVWELVPPYMPMRPERLAYDHCPQLDALDRPDEVEVIKEQGAGPYIDIDLYQFALWEDYRTQTVAGHPRRLLRSLDECRELMIPPAAKMWVEFGIREERVEGRKLRARFQLSIQKNGQASEVLLDRTLTPESESPWRGRWIRLGKYGYQRVQLCVSTEASGEMNNPEDMVAWSSPLIRSSVHHPYEERKESHVSERERKLREQQLKALGYVN